MHIFPYLESKIVHDSQEGGLGVPRDIKKSANVYGKNNTRCHENT